MDTSRYAAHIRECTPGRCKVPTIQLMVGRTLTAVEAAPHKDGVIRLRDTGGPLPVADRLTVAQQFGRQGTLHRKHECKVTREAERHRRAGWVQR